MMLALGLALPLVRGGPGGNLNDNPNALGAVAGSPGTLPTGWTSVGTAVTRTIIGTTTLDGVTGLLVQYAGVPSGTGLQALTLGAAETAAVGTVVSNTVFLALIVGGFANTSTFTLRAGASESATALVITPTGVVLPYTNVQTLIGTTSATQLRWNYVNTTDAVDFTLFIGWPIRRRLG